ncbi:MAG: VWA domain-containing protein, partial [Rikenellaceae bacterium]
GLVVFAGDAFVQLPITSDFVSARNFVEYISPQMVANQGTDIGKALSLAARSFSAQSDKSRAIILISDGEDHGGDMSGVVNSITEAGIPIHVVGIGSPEGAPITIGGQQMKDENGAMVVSKLGEEMLQQMALTTGGSYIRATNQSMGLDEIIKQIRKMDNKEFSSMVFDEYNEQFQYILAISLFLLLIEFVILERKNQFIARLTIFNKK